MFGFSRITKYDEDYLNEKKRTLEDLLGIKERLEKICLEYDEYYSFLSKSYETAQKTDYVGLVLKRNRHDKSKKSMDEMLREALDWQKKDISKLKLMKDIRFKVVFNGELLNPSASYHSIFKNTYDAEKVKFDNATYFYKEIGLLEFIKSASDLDTYLRVLNIIYSTFLANEYSKLKQVR